MSTDACDTYSKSIYTDFRLQPKKRLWKMFFAFLFLFNQIMISSFHYYSGTYSLHSHSNLSIQLAIQAIVLKQFICQVSDLGWTKNEKKLVIYYYIQENKKIYPFVKNIISSISLLIFIRTLFWNFYIILSYSTKLPNSKSTTDAINFDSLDKQWWYLW